MITIPKLSDLKASVKTDLEAQFTNSIPVVGKVFLNALCIVQAAKLKLLYLTLGFIQKNVFPDTADPESKGGTLERFGRIKLGRNPFPATAGQYTLTVTGSIGAVIKAETTFKSDDSSLNPGVLYVVDNQKTLTATTDTVLVRALTAGVSGKLSVNNTLTATSPIANVLSQATVSTESITPVDAETTEAYRTALLNSFRQEPQGGAASDYRIWSQDVSGVAKVYPYAKSGSPGEVNIYVEAVLSSSTDGKGTPSSIMQSNVLNAIEQSGDTTIPVLERGRRPITAKPNVLPISPKNIDIIVTGYQNITTAIQSLLVSAITDAINKMRPFISGSDVLAEKNDILDNNRVIAVILTQTPGAVFTSVTIKVNTNVVTTYTFTDGNIPFVNSITFV